MESTNIITTKTTIEKINELLEQHESFEFLKKLKMKRFKNLLERNCLDIVDENEGLFSCRKCGHTFFRYRSPMPTDKPWFVCPANGCNDPVTKKKKRQQEVDKFIAGFKEKRRMRILAEKRKIKDGDQ